MINIRPVSDLRNKYPEIEEIVLKENESVFLTKNGYGTMVVMSLEKYAELTKDIDIAVAKLRKNSNIDINKLLEESEKELDNPNTKYLTHDQVFDKMRRMLNE